MKDQGKIVVWIANIAFWVFVAGMLLSIFKGLSLLAVALLVLSILLFVLFAVVYFAQKIFRSKKGSQSTS